MKIMQIVSCLELMTNLFIFIHNGKKVIKQPQLKNGTHFFCHERLSKGYNVLNEFMFQSHMRFSLMQWSATRFYSSLSMYSHPFPSQKIAPWQPS